MKRHCNLIFLVLTIGHFACNSDLNKRVKHEYQFECDSLSDKKVIYNIADSILKNHDNTLFWNLSKVDTTYLFTIEDNFTNTRTRSRLVLIGGEAGSSSGTIRNMLILFSCSDTFRIIWAEQFGDLSSSDIQDLNGDGIKEIISQSSATWMGECHDNYEILNFVDENRNTLYSAQSISLIDCGAENWGGKYKLGDTLEHKFECSLLKNENQAFYVYQIETTKIHDGGLNSNELVKSLKIKTDTNKVMIK